MLPAELRHKWAARTSDGGASSDASLASEAPNSEPDDEDEDPKSSDGGDAAMDDVHGGDAGGLGAEAFGVSKSLDSLRGPVDPCRLQL